MAYAYPFFKWYPSDAEMDENYSSMSDKELGFFHRCLNKAWINGGLPEDPERLAASMRVTVKYLAKVWPAVSRCFVLTETVHPRYVNPRQELERSELATKSVKATESVKRRYERSPNVDETSYEVPTTALLRDRAHSDSDSDSSSFSSLEEKSAEKGNLSAPQVAAAISSEVGFPLEPMSVPAYLDPGGESFALKAPDQQQGWFTAWWASYWLKKSRAEAESAFRKLVKTEPLFDSVMSATRAQTPEMAAREPSKRPYGATWLNARRWEDEVLPLAVLSAPRQLSVTERAKLSWEAKRNGKPA